MGTHWIENGTKRDAFFAKASRLGLSERGQLLALGVVNSVDEFEGTLEQALGLLEQYSVSLAAGELKDAMKAMPEAPVLAWTTFQKGPGGQQWTISVRGGLPPAQADAVMQNLFRQITKIETWLEKNKYLPLYDTRMAIAGSPPSPPPSGNGKQPTQSAPGSAGSNGHTRIKEGALQLLTIKPQGKYEFEVAGAQFPLKDQRGPGIVSSLFDNSCFTATFTKELLEEPGVITPKTFGALLVKYGKSSTGFWDVLQVRPE